MPEINFSPYVEWIIVIGAISGALTAIILLSIKLITGLTWVSKKHQSVVLAPATQDIEQLKSKQIQIQSKQEEILKQLISDNNNSMRQKLNGIHTIVERLGEDLESHRKWSYQQHAIIDEKLRKYGLAGPISDVDGE